MEKEKQISKKIIDLELYFLEKENNIYIKHLHNKINFYEQQIKNLNQENYFNIQKKKIQENNFKIEEYNNKLFELYIKLEKEIENSQN